MKTIRKKINTVAFVLSSLVLFTSCSNSNEISMSDNFTGKELFVEIFFAKGKVADALPTIKNSYSHYEINNIIEKQSEEFEENINEITNYIEKNNPNYFKNFKKRLKTRDYNLISETFKQASELLYKSAVDLYLSKAESKELDNALKDIDIKNFRNDDGSINYELLRSEVTEKYHANSGSRRITFFAGVVLVAAAYILVVHAAAAMTYVAIAWAVEKYAAIDNEVTITREIQSTGSITNEMLISDIVKLNL